MLQGIACLALLGRHIVFVCEGVEGLTVKSGAEGWMIVGGSWVAGGSTTVPVAPSSGCMKGLLAVRSRRIMAVEPTKRKGVICSTIALLITSQHFCDLLALFSIKMTH